MTSYIGSVFSFGFNFAPAGWFPCDGRILPIAQYDVLFNLIGTTYGGDGITSFALPDLRSRVPIGTGQGPGLSDYFIGQSSGTEQVTLNSNNLPPHTHTVTSAQTPVSDRNSDSGDPTGRFFGLADTNTGNIYAPAGGAAMGNSTGNTDPTGNGLPLDIRNPYQAVSYCICFDGVYPSPS